MSIVYKLTFPNGKIYIGQAATDDIMYFGSPDPKFIEKDFTRKQKRDFTIRRETLWESRTATQADVNRKEREKILEYKANNPTIGYNQRPKYNLLEWEVGEKDKNQTLREKRAGGKFQMWESDRGRWGVVEIVNNQYKVHLRCTHSEDEAREVLEKLAPISKESTPNKRREEKMIITSNKSKSLIPTEQMKEALKIWKFLLFIRACIQQNLIDFCNLPQKCTIKTKTGKFDLDLTSLTSDDFNIISNNSLISGVGLCAIAFDNAMNIAFGGKGKEFPMDKTDLTSARAIMYQIRNAFAHEPLHPSWYVKNIHYLKSFKVEEIGLEVNLNNLNGKVFQPEHVGGDKGLFDLFYYCMKQVDAKEKSS